MQHTHTLYLQYTYKIYMYKPTTTLQHLRHTHTIPAKSLGTLAFGKQQHIPLPQKQYRLGVINSAQRESVMYFMTV